MAHYRSQVVSLMELANIEIEKFSFAACEAQLNQVQAAFTGGDDIDIAIQVAYDAVKAALLHAGAKQHIPIPGMIETLEQNSRIRRMARQMVKAIHYLSELSTLAEVQAQETTPIEVSEPESDH